MGKRPHKAVRGFRVAETRLSWPVAEEHEIESSGADKMESRTVSVEAEIMEQEIEQV